VVVRDEEDQIVYHKLKIFGERISASVRPSDTVARLAGDEFVIILEGLHTTDERQFIARKILAATLKRACDQPCPSAGHDQHWHAFTGVKTYTIELMRRACGAVYQAKAEGRGAFRLAP
jgi:diguanylate cyclase (GGDEF)-like protein